MAKLVLRYMAPEYFMHGLVHEKTDVFAFGVLLLELITGRRAVDSSRQSLVMSVWLQLNLLLLTWTMYTYAKRT